jgi:hypothetical protein
MINRRDFLLNLVASTLVLPVTPLFALSLDTGTTRRFRYQILFGGSEVGQHTVTVSKEASGKTLVEHHRKLELQLLFIPLLTIEKTSQERWDGDVLVDLRALSHENGERHMVEGHCTQDGFAVRGPSGDFLAPAGIATTESFWGTWALNKTHLLDTVKGKVLEPKLTPLKGGRWYLEHGKLKADIGFEGELMTDAILDTDGHSIQLIRDVA